eukprot:gene3080-3625_t
MPSAKKLKWMETSPKRLGKLFFQTGTPAAESEASEKSSPSPQAEPVEPALAVEPPALQDLVEPASVTPVCSSSSPANSDGGSVDLFSDSNSEGQGMFCPDSSAALETETGPCSGPAAPIAEDPQDTGSGDVIPRPAGSGLSPVLCVPHLGQLLSPRGGAEMPPPPLPMASSIHPSALSPVKSSASLDLESPSSPMQLHQPYILPSACSPGLASRPAASPTLGVPPSAPAPRAKEDSPVNPSSIIPPLASPALPSQLGLHSPSSPIHGVFTAVQITPGTGSSQFDHILATQTPPPTITPNGLLTDGLSPPAPLPPDPLLGFQPSAPSPPPLPRVSQVSRSTNVATTSVSTLLDRLPDQPPGLCYASLPIRSLPCPAGLPTPPEQPSVRHLCHNCLYSPLPTPAHPYPHFYPPAIPLSEQACQLAVPGRLPGCARCGGSPSPPPATAAPAVGCGDHAGSSGSEDQGPAGARAGNRAAQLQSPLPEDPAALDLFPDADPPTNPLEPLGIPGLPPAVEPANTAGWLGAGVCAAGTPITDPLQPSAAPPSSTPRPPPTRIPSSAEATPTSAGTFRTPPQPTFGKAPLMSSVSAHGVTPEAGVEPFARGSGRSSGAGGGAADPVFSRYHHLSVLCTDIFVATRGALKPDPQLDPVCMIAMCLHPAEAVRAPSWDRWELLLVDPESAPSPHPAPAPQPSPAASAPGAAASHPPPGSTGAPAARGGAKAALALGQSLDGQCCTGIQAPYGQGLQPLRPAPAMLQVPQLKIGPQPAAASPSQQPSLDPCPPPEDPVPSPAAPINQPAV